LYGEARRLDLPDLPGNQAQARHLAPQFGQRVGRHRLFLWGAQPLEPFRGCAQGWLEAADAEPCQGALDPVADARALADEFLALAARPLAVLLFQARESPPCCSVPARRAASRETLVSAAPCRADRSSPGDAHAKRQCCLDANG
jgi:hypothetical protein